MAITDLTGTTWMFGASIPYQYSTAFSYAINYDYELLWSDFLTGSQTSLGLAVSSHNYYFPRPQPSGTTASGTTGSWEVYYGYRTAPTIKSNFDGFQSFKITITGGDDVTNATLISWLEANATQQTVSTKVSVDLTTLPGWESLSDGSHTITIVAKADGYRDSEPSEAVSVTKAATMPAKGDIITIEDKRYRVLKMSGTVAEVLCMYDANRSIAFDSASSNYNDTYAGKNIDTYCNNTFYSGLSAAMKSAIVDKTFTQDSWMRQNSAPTESHYTGKYSSSTYYLTLVNAAYGSSITRHCYCLSVQDVLDYLEATTSMGTSDTTLTDTNIWKMFWNVTTSQSWKYIWLRSAYSSRSDCAFVVIGNSGELGYNDVYGTFAARPAFQIDLSKISWS